LRQKLDKADIIQKTKIKKIADFIRRVMPTSSSHEPTSKNAPLAPLQKTRRGTPRVEIYPSLTILSPVILSNSRSFICKTPKLEPIPRKREDNDDVEDVYDDDANFVEEETQAYFRENVGSVASPCLMPYVYKKCFLDTQYVIRKESDIYMGGDSQIV